MKRIGYLIAKAISIALVIAAIITLLPHSSASTECFLGYSAVCSFAPVSTFLLLLSSAAVYVWANYVFMCRNLL